MTKEIITKEFIKGKTLVFTPTNFSEAAFIINQLQKIEEENISRLDEQEGTKNLSKYVCSKIVLRNGIIGNHLDEERYSNFVLCSIDQFEEDYATSTPVLLLSGEDLIRENIMLMTKKEQQKQDILAEGISSLQKDFEKAFTNPMKKKNAFIKKQQEIILDLQRENKKLQRYLKI